MDIQIKRKPSGIRYVRPYMGRTPDGRVRRPYHEFPDSMTDAEVEEAARRWLDEIRPGYDAGATHYVGDLLERYVRHMEQSGRAGNSVRTYRSLAKHCETIAGKAARDVSVLDIEAMYSSLMLPRADGGAGLGAKTIQHLHWFLSGAFSWMLHMGVVDVNPLRDVEQPRARPFDAQAFEGEDFDAMVAMVAEECQCEADTDEGALWREVAFGALLALHTGMRSGEVCALRRTDFRPMAKTLRVCGTVTEPKGGPVRQPTTKGRKSRVVAVSDELAEAIVAHDAHYATRDLRSMKSPLVSVDGIGLMRPSTLSSTFGRMCRAHGLVGYKFHSLRHTHASQLLAAGVDIKTVSERLGHADVKTTLETYAHVLPGRDAHAARLFSEIMGGGGGW